MQPFIFNEPLTSLGKALNTRAKFLRHPWWRDDETAGNSVSLRILLTCIALNIGWSQGSTAQISGTITDSSGAILPGVEVTATQTETGVTRSALTNETGAYVSPNLPVGPYKIEAALMGFRTFVQTGIVLQVFVG